VKEKLGVEGEAQPEGTQTGNGAVYLMGDPAAKVCPGDGVESPFMRIEGLAR
jgi:hypothetical protein